MANARSSRSACCSQSPGPIAPSVRRVHIDRDNRHCYLTPRIRVSSKSFAFDIIYEVPRPVKPDPYLVWDDSPCEPAVKRRPNLTVVTTWRPVQNFRRMHALILHGADQNRTVLERALVRLGLTLSPLDPAMVEPACHDPAEEADIVFVDADSGSSVQPPCAPGQVPLVSMIGHETPSRLQRAFDMHPTAFLLKPVRPHGVSRPSPSRSTSTAGASRWTLSCAASGSATPRAVSSPRPC